jgi:16S rRNA A1518/A1519 N6-dimethyltransferase RsmA/KsgA/DIM1 with predicted DNA glycosylase/AP lyase activity
VVDGRLQVIYGDALEVDMNSEEIREKLHLTRDQPVHLMGNLPFAISRALVYQLIDRESQAKGIWSHPVGTSFMFQREVARLICAEPGADNYKRFSVECQSWFDVSTIYKVPRNVFVPPPRVDADVVHFRSRRGNCALKTTSETLRMVVEAGLSHSNRLVSSNLGEKLVPQLRQMHQQFNRTSSSKVMLRDVLRLDEHVLRKRANMVSPDEWCHIANSVADALKKI